MFSRCFSVSPGDTLAGTQSHVLSGGPKQYNQDYPFTGVKEKVPNDFSRHKDGVSVSTTLYTADGLITVFFICLVGF